MIKKKKTVLRHTLKKRLKNVKSKKEKRDTMQTEHVEWNEFAWMEMSEYEQRILQEKWTKFQKTKRENQPLP